MRLSTRLIIVFSGVLALSSCAELPDRPDVDLCLIDVERSQLICAPTGQTSTTNISHEAIKNIVLNSERKTRIPIAEADKYISFSPGDWEKISVYVKTIRSIAERKCE